MQTAISKAQVDSNRRRLAAPDGESLLSDVADPRQLDNGRWHVVLAAGFADAWDGSGHCYSHYVGEGVTKEEAREAAFADFRQRVPVAASKAQGN